ncbi:MAG: TolC family protein [Acidobacteria bacterium]|jgi:HAE1 family hydrophobic/amphiphilic exporter-1|nr:TolC family protein [Acidobacteriota bacterium]
MTARTLSVLVLALAVPLAGGAAPLPQAAPPPTGPAATLASPPTLELTLTQAVEYALDRNPTAQRARETINEFNLQVRQVRADALPQLDLTLSAQKFRDPGLRNSPAFGDLPDFLPPEALGPYSFNDYTYSFRLEQPLYTFGRVGNALKAAREQLNAVKEDVRSVESVVARDTAIAYYDLLLARDRLAVFESERASRERQLERVKDRLALEDATRLDVLNAEVALANLRPQVLGAENEVAVSLARLNEVLGRPIDAPLELTDGLQLPDPLPFVPDYEVLLAQAARTRPELLRFEYGRRVLEAGQKVTRADTLPEISAAGNVGVSSFDVNNLGDLSFRNWNVGVFLRWKLFDGFRTSSAVGRLESQVQQSRLEEAAFRNALAREVERSSGEWKRGLEAVEVAELAAEQAAEAQRLAEESFQWGAATVLEILEAQRQVQQAELSKAESYYVALTALADVKFLVGLRPDVPLDVVLAEAPLEGPAPTEEQQP